MTQKSGLAYPENPLSVMRELQELSPVTPEPAKKPRTLNPNKSSSEVASATSSVAANVTDEAATSLRRRSSRQKTNDDEQKNPLNEVLIQLLAKPYESETKSGPFTSTTVKIQTELWERLGHASALTNLPKQEILAEALRDYFRKMVKGQ